jgi:hypothetical protein
MGQKEVVTWIVPLVGHAFDLGDMRKWLEGSDVAAVKYEEAHALSIPVKIVGSASEHVLPFAERKLTLLNGIGRLLEPKYRPATLDGRFYGLDATGRKVNTVLSIQSAEIRIKTGVVGLLVGGVAAPDPAIGAAIPLLDVAANSERAHDALTILARKDLTWSELYLLFELVQGEVGSRMYDEGWVSKSDANLFCHTANSYSALRSDGRHGKDLGAPPANPMDRHSALALLRRLVLSWLRSKVAA